MRPALLVVDLLRDTFDKHQDSYIVQTARHFLPLLNDWLDWFHQHNLPTIFACDSFLPDDFIFQGKMNPHSLRGTAGAEPIADLHRYPESLILPKRRFSSFYKTDLDQTLRSWHVDTIVVTGLATHVCVLTTALDAVANDFHAIILADCCTAHSQHCHDAVLEAYRTGPLFPLLQVMKSTECREYLENRI